MEKEELFVEVPNGVVLITNELIEQSNYCSTNTQIDVKLSLDEMKEC